MRRHGPGARHHLLKQQQIKSQLKEEGEKINALNIESARKICEDFQAQLNNFSSTYRERINKDVEFRKKFFEMCLAVGVDPLAAAGAAAASGSGLSSENDETANLSNHIEEAVEAADVFWDSVANRTQALAITNTFKRQLTKRPF